MKIPRLSDLTDPEQRNLYERDRFEVGNQEPDNFNTRFYRVRFDETILAISRLQKRLGKMPSEIRVLDLGCAQGNYSLRLAEMGFKVIAVDLKLNFLSYGRMKFEKGNLQWVNASLEALPFSSGVFDLVFAGEVIEHVAYPSGLLAELKKVCSRSGHILVTTPNGARLGTGMPTLSAISDRKALESKQFVPDAGGHLFLMTADELVKEGKQAGLRMIDHKYMATPWVTGGMRAGILIRVFPLFLRRMIDKLIIKTPFLAPSFSEGQAAFFQHE